MHHRRGREITSYIAQLAVKQLKMLRVALVKERIVGLARFKQRWDGHVFGSRRLCCCDCSCFFGHYCSIRAVHDSSQASWGRAYCRPTKNKNSFWRTAVIGHFLCVFPTNRKLDLTDNFFNGLLSATAGKLRELEELRLDVNQVGRQKRRTRLKASHAFGGTSSEHFC